MQVEIKNKFMSIILVVNVAEIRNDDYPVYFKFNVPNLGSPKYIWVDLEAKCKIGWLQFTLKRKFSIELY